MTYNKKNVDDLSRSGCVKRESGSRALENVGARLNVTLKKTRISRVHLSIVQFAQNVQNSLTILVKKIL